MVGFEQAHDRAHDEAHDQAHDPLSETEAAILGFLATGAKSRPEIAEFLGVKTRRSGHLLRAIERLRDLNLAELTIPEKPQSKNQRLRITEKGRNAASKNAGGDSKGT